MGLLRVYPAFWMSPPPRRSRAYACLAASMALVGAYVALSKPLTEAMPVLLLAWLRFGIGAVAMLGWLRKPTSEPPLSGRTRWLLFLESFLGNFLFSICMLYGVSMTHAVSAGVIMAAIPASVAVLSRLFLQEQVSRRTWTGVGFAGLGILLLALSRPGQAGPTASDPLLGNLLVFGAVLCEAAYAVIGKMLTVSLGPRRIASLINLWGFVLMTPFGLLYALDFEFGSVQPSTWVLLVFYALAASVWTVWLWMTGLRVVPAAQGGIFTVMLPIAATAVGVLLLGESFTLLHALALAAALAGVVLATLPVRAPG